MRFKYLVASALMIGTVAIGTVQAAPTTFFGEDLNRAGDPNQLAVFTNSNSARANFFANLNGVGTETFNGIAVGTSNPAVSFAVPSGTVTATLQGGIIASGFDGGRYPISSPNYLDAGRTAFTINFSQGISAFGFYGVDVGDFGGQLTLRLTSSTGALTDLLVANTIGVSGSTTGSVLYAGFFDTSTTYTSISFLNNSGGNDAFGFDDFSVGTLAQVVPVPEPTSMALFGVALASLGLVHRRRRA